MRELTIALAMFVSWHAVGAAENWPQWRGPAATGVSPEQNLPARWSLTENLVWKAPLAGVGVSTPIVWGDHVFVTSQVGAVALREGNHPTLVQGGGSAEAGEKMLVRDERVEGASGVTFVVEAFSRVTGKRLWEHRLPAVGQLAEVHKMHNLASPSPVTDGERVYAWFGTGQIVVLDMNGKVVWTRHLGQEISPFQVNWGHTSSPMLYKDSLILLADHEPASYLLSVDARTGKERWKVDRGKGRTSYSTPFVVEAPSGPELMVNSSERVDVYDPRTGEHLWFFGDKNGYPIPMPVYHDGVIYLSRGYRSGPYAALKPGGRGDISKSSVIWSVGTGAPYVSSLVHWDGIIYMVNDVGGAMAIDAKTGARIWQERMNGIFAASLSAGDGKIYIPSETGEVIVLRAGRTPEVIARNDIGERIVASLAISNGQIFIRGDGNLFCIGGSQSTGN